MKLGLAGRRALICASTQGLGYACAKALAEEGASVVINGRDSDRVAGAVASLREESGGEVAGAAGDLTTQAGRAAMLAACPDPDILVNNNAGPEPGNFFALDHNDWIAALEANMVAPILLVQAVAPAMRRRKFGRIINITSAMVTTPRAHMTLSAGPRAGLTAVMKGLSLDLAKDNVTINNLLPERINTARQQHMAEVAMQRDKIDYDEARRRQVASIAAGRLGEANEVGAMCAFLCSDLAGFVSGQNVHLDGGSYPALV